MPAYVINDMVVTDPELFERYKQLSPPTVAQYGGRFLARGGQVDTLEGDWSPRRVVIIEFPSLERAMEMGKGDRDTAALMFIREKELGIEVRQKPVALKTAA